MREESQAFTTTATGVATAPRAAGHRDENEGGAVAGSLARVDPQVGDALGVFVAAQWDDMIAFAYFRLRDWHAAEDAASESIRRVLPTWHVALGRAREAATPERAEMAQRLYLYKALNQACLDALRRRKVREQTVSLDVAQHGEVKGLLVDGNGHSANPGNTQQPLERFLLDESDPDPTLRAVCERETVDELRALVGETTWVTLLLQVEGWTLAEVAAALPAPERGRAKTAGALKTDQWRLHQMARDARARDYRPIPLNDDTDTDMDMDTDAACAGDDEGAA